MRPNVPTPATMALAILVACAGDKGEDSTSPDDLTISNIEITRSEIIPTVSTVTWTTSAPAHGRVRFGEEGGELGLTTADSESLATEHSAVLIGLYEGAQGSLVVEAWNDQAEVSADPQSFEVGILDAELPRPTVLLGDPADSVGGFFLMPTSALFARYVSIADAHGRLVWGYGGGDLETQRARFTQDGTGLIFMSRDITQATMDLVRMDWDGTVRWQINVPEGHHDFDLIDDDTFLSLAYDHRVFTDGADSIDFDADKLIEIDVSGETSTVWTLYDHIQVENPDVLVDPKGGIAHWSHSNFVHYLPDSDEVLITSREINIAWSINRSDGSVNWMLNDLRGDFENIGSSPVTAHPHSVWPIDGGVVVFNQGQPDSASCATVSTIDLDQAEGTAEVTWTYASDPCYSTDYLGNAQPLADGHMLVSYGKVGVIDEIIEGTGEVVMRWGLSANQEMLYVEHAATLGLPEN